jgi:hypothetical protein
VHPIIAQSITFLGTQTISVCHQYAYNLPSTIPPLFPLFLSASSSAPAHSSSFFPTSSLRHACTCENKDMTYVSDLLFEPYPPKAVLVYLLPYLRTFRSYFRRPGNNVTGTPPLLQIIIRFCWNQPSVNAEWANHTLFRSSVTGGCINSLFANSIFRQRIVLAFISITKIQGYQGL